MKEAGGVMLLRFYTLTRTVICSRVLHMKGFLRSCPPGAVVLERKPFDANITFKKMYTYQINIKKILTSKK